MNVFVQLPSQQRININAANIDRFVVTLMDFRLENQLEPMEELVTLIKAAEQFSDGDVRMMFAIMLLREAERR